MEYIIAHLDQYYVVEHGIDLADLLLIYSVLTYRSSLCNSNHITTVQMYNYSQEGHHNDQPLYIIQVPVHLRTNWDSFYVEILMLAGLGVYFLNFLQGKSKNHKLAQSWLSAHRDILEQNFSIVGRQLTICNELTLHGTYEIDFLMRSKTLTNKLSFVSDI